MKRATRISVMIALLCAVLAIAGCGGVRAADLGQPVPDQAYRSITPEETMEALGKKGVVLADVRETDEQADGMIDGAISLPLSTLLSTYETALPDTDAVIILYCASGQRSAKAAGMLARKGYVNVFDMGAVSAWPAPLVTPEAAPAN